MSDEECSDSSRIFSVIRFKALDYVCEAATSLQVAMNCLALPMPYDAGDSDLYPHCGKVPEVTYRTPWIRGNVISTCKLFVGGSVLEDLRVNGQPVNTLESVPTLKRQHVEMIPSSNPNSQGHEDMDEDLWLLQVPQKGDLCQEAFSKSTKEQNGFINQHEDLLMAEEVMIVDHLPQFRRHLPTLSAKLSRLRTLLVSDPLLSPTGAPLSQDTLFRHCAPYEMPPAVDSQNSLDLSNTYMEQFDKEPLMNNESLMLPIELDTFTLNREIDGHFTNIHNILHVAPEPTEERTSSLDLLRTLTSSDELQMMDISLFEAPKGISTHCAINKDVLDTQSAGHLMLPTAMELDLTLSPTPKTSQAQLLLSPSLLCMEQLSPVYKHCLVSERDEEDMELAVWKAEKHPSFVLGFLLTEPQICEPALNFQPLAEAFRLLWISPEISVSIRDKIELQPRCMTGGLEVYATGTCESTETLSFERPQATEDDTEDFSTLSACQIEYILKICQEDDAAPLSVREVGARSILRSPTQPVRTSQQMEDKSGRDPGIAEAVIGTTTTTTNQETTAYASQNYQSSHTMAMTKEEHRTSAFPASTMTTNSEKDGKTFSADASCAFNPLESTSSHRVGPVVKNDRSPEQEASVPTKTTFKDNHWSFTATRPPSEKALDPLSSFMMLRSQQRTSVLVAPQKYTSTPVPEMELQTPQPAPVALAATERSTQEQKPVSIPGAVAGNATRVQEQPVSQAGNQPVVQHRHDSKVVEVQATEGQWRAFCELQTFAQPCLSRASELGLNSAVWGEFSSLAPDQTRFLVKQQEKQLSRTQGQVHEQQFNQVVLIHILVTAKDLLLRCDLNTAVEYLDSAVETCPGRGLEQQLKRLQVLLFLSSHQQEPSAKLLELQDQLAAWLHGRTGQKVLVIIAVDSERVRSVLIKGLSHVTGEAVIAVCPEEGKSKLNGARLLSSVRGSVCVVVCGQHIGADFPWQSFSLVVEFDHSGQSPWPAVCKEQNISHLTFHTTLPHTDEDPDPWSLEHNVPYVLLVTEGLLNCPQLLQILESTYNITVLERIYSQSLQMLGGSHQYAVVTVDESIAIIIQGQEELCQQRASENIVMRLTALSLQYNCCWLVLHCPASQGAGLTSEGFNNMVLIYSSLVLFGMKSENLDIKVLMVSDAADVAQWISRICFHSLMASDREPGSYLDRSWLSVMPSEEERFLLGFPCVNPLVGQLMLRRAPSLQWLLEAPLPALEELLPEVPHKVLKLFTDTTSLYKLTTDTSPPDPHTPSTETNHSPPNAEWIMDRDPRQHPQANPQDPFSGTSQGSSFLCSSSRPERPTGSFCGQRPAMSPADFQVELRTNLSQSEARFQESWANDSLWEEDEEKEGKSAGWCGGGGGTTRGGGEDWIQRPYATQEPHSGYRGTSGHLYTTTTTTTEPFQLESSFGFPANAQQPAHCTTSQTSFCPGDNPRDRKCPNGVALGSSRWAAPWGGASRGGDGTVSCGQSTRISPDYGFNCWMGRERKRSGETAGMDGTALAPLKRGKLSYERVPGRSDGQTRLRFF